MADEPNKDAATLLTEALWRDPEARMEIQRQTKRLFPKAPTPELDAVDLTSKMTGELDRATKAREALEKERDALALDRERKAAIAKHGLTEGDIPEIEKIMVDRLAGTHDLAAEIIANRRAIADIAPPRLGPTPMLVPGVQTPKDEFFTTGPSGHGIANHPGGPMKWASERAQEQLIEIWRQKPELRPAGVR